MKKPQRFRIKYLTRIREGEALRNLGFVLYASLPIKGKVYGLNRKSYKVAKVDHVLRAVELIAPADWSPTSN